MSVFGGPHDHGVSPAEGLALVSNVDDPNFKDLFLPAHPHGTKGLARRLNPDKYYIAMRWSYTKTTKKFLSTIEVKVTNFRTRESLMARPVDYGPHEKTGRIADLSPGLAKDLDLATDDWCTVTIPLPK
jgi:hypothetical protein